MRFCLIGLATAVASGVLAGKNLTLLGVNYVLWQNANGEFREGCSEKCARKYVR